MKIRNSTFRLPAKLCNLLLVFATLISFKTAYSQTYTVTGTVLSENGNKIQGATVSVKESSVSATTDKDGIFQLNAAPTSTLVVSHVGYSTVEVPVQGRKILQVSLAQIVTTTNEVVVVAYGTQKKIAVTGAVNSMSVKQIAQVSTPSISNAIAGKMPGIITRQASGEPGYDAAQVYIRGLATPGTAAPLTIVDGVERNMNQINAQEIESFTILKDATATAVYGLRGANGVIIINTKRGTTGKPQITLRSEVAQLHAMRLPKYIQAYDYASLWNEALDQRNEPLRWTPEELAKFKDGSDPYLYPNSNWIDAVFNKNTMQTIHNLSVSGGSDIIKYYTNIGYTSQSGLYKKDPSNAYNTNTLINRYNFRNNIDIRLFPTLTMQLGVGGIIQKGNYPGYSSWEILNATGVVSPIAYAVQNPDGTPGGSQTYVGYNPWARTTQSGYTTEDRNTLQSTFGLNWDLSKKVKGLSARGLFSYDKNNIINNVRYKQFVVKQYLGKDASGKDIYSIPFREEAPMTYRVDVPYDIYNNANMRQIYWEGQLNYIRHFGEHEITGMALINRSDKVDLTANKSLFNLPYRKQGLAARVTYNYGNRYMLEGDLGYNGSENFPKDHRYGLFPAISGAWIISNEKFWKVNFINQFKIRGSYGIVGNDQNIAIFGSRRFLYLSTTNLNGQGYLFGPNQVFYAGMEEDQIGNPDVSWERSRKSNIGLDIAMMGGKINLQIDAFKEYRWDILLVKQNVPRTTGIYPWSIPISNVGVVRNKGVDGLLEIRNRLTSGWFYNMRGNFTYATNTVVEDGTVNPLYPYMQTRGRRLGQPIGYVADGYFKDAADIASSPRQSFGSVRPGDIKYKDINGDGKIDSYDQLPIGNPRLPEMTFGFGGTLGYKNVDFSIYFTGAAGTSLNVGPLLYPFYNNIGVGNILEEYYNNRWTPATPNALYPAVDRGNNPNNFVQSNLWMRNGNYLRLRNAEIGYNYPVKNIKSVVKTFRLFVNGTNLYTWDNIKFIDPESNNGQFGYPLQRSINVGAQIDFK